MTTRTPVAKTYKLFIGGAFPRSESGRTHPVSDRKGRLVAHVAWASRKDLRDAVRAARGAHGAWAARTPYNRAQIVYRVAEVLEGRRAQFEDELGVGGMTPRAARADVDAAVDAAVYWAGFADKHEQLVGGVNPVAGPFLNVSQVIPLGVCGLACPDDGGVAGLVGLIGPALAAGNTAVAIAGGPSALVTSTLGEVLATSDIPGGVVNLLTGDHAALMGWLVDHAGVDMVDLSGVAPEARGELVARTAENLTRSACTEGREDLATIQAFCDVRTVWHPARI